jgi:hypothetical protein
VYWGPGYVGWYRTGSHVAWTPLAPNETFYGRRYYGRNSVNITTVQVNTTAIVYRNRNNPGGLTVQQHNDFLKGRTPVQQSSANPSFPVAVSVGGPHIQPTRETRMPIVNLTPTLVAPPQVKHQDSRDLRTRFPRVSPEPASQQRQPQTVPAIAAPSAVPSSRPPQTRVNQPTYPAGVPVPSERAATPVRQSQPPEPQQREERRQRPAQPAEVPQTIPPVSGAIPQRFEQPRPAAANPVNNQNRPAAAQRGETHQAPPTAGAPGTVQQPRDMKQKKVWNIQTQETDGEKDTRGGNKSREHKDR